MPEKPVWLPPTFGPIPKPVTTSAGFRRYDVSYSIEGGFRPLELELFTPDLSKPTPLIVWIHGGGYAGGTRKAGTPWFEESNYHAKALERGFAFASIDYRLGYEASFPAAVNDAHAALRWLAKFADQLNIDVSHTILWGESAGGHLAALTAGSLGDEYFEGVGGAEKSSALKIVGVVDWYGATDLNTIVRPMDGTDLSAPEIFRFPPEYFNLGADRWKDSTWLAKASPVSYISADYPPTLLVHGDADTMVPLQQSKALATKLAEQGVEHELVVVPGGEHGFMGLEQPKFDALVELSLDFMQKQCPR